MTITFELCGVLERLAGTAELSLDIAGTTVEAALDVLAGRIPALAEHLPRAACAVGDAMVLRADPLPSGARLALLPPVAGG